MNGINICVYSDTLGNSIDGIDDDNLCYIKVKEDVLFNWFKENILEGFREEIDEKLSDRAMMDEWLDVYTADETVDLYGYAKLHCGIIL